MWWLYLHIYIYIIYIYICIYIPKIYICIYIYIIICLNHLSLVCSQYIFHRNVWFPVAHKTTMKPPLSHRSTACFHGVTTPNFHTCCWLNSAKHCKTCCFTMFYGKITMFHQNASDTQLEILENKKAFHGFSRTTIWLSRLRSLGAVMTTRSLVPCSKRWKCTWRNLPKVGKLC